jgi:transposase InsO family protein
VIPEGTVALIVRLRRQLTAQGFDAGSDTIGWHLEHHHNIALSRATIDRTLRRQGLVRPAPSKRPRPSHVRFQADQPNEMWQADFTHDPLGSGEDCEILSWLDDHARHALSVTAHHRVTGPIVLATFRAGAAQHGLPASTPTDNGMVFTTRPAGGRGGRNAFKAELRRLGITQKNSRPNHPTTCGKVERFHQTLKNWLRAQPHQPATVAELQARCNTFVELQALCNTVAELQARCNTFVELYNHQRPHRCLPGRITPAAAYQLHPKAHPGDSTHDTHGRVRHDQIDKTGRVTSATTAASTTSASAAITPEPALSRSSPTATSASSTPPPPTCSPTSSSTPPATTSASAADPNPNPENHNGPNPIEGSDRPGCLATSHMRPR